MAKQIKSKAVVQSSLIAKPAKKKKRKKKKVLSPQEIEQRAQKKEIRNLMSNIGFSRIPHVDGKEFTYDGRTGELDDIFFFENIIVLAEYTVGASGGKHLFPKKILYDKINEDPQKFLKFLLSHDKFTTFADVVKNSIQTKYTLNQAQVRIVYASKSSIAQEHKDNVPGIHFFDYSIVKYFESISKIIKKSTKYEFFDFLGVDFSKVGENIKVTATTSADDFSGHILPEEHSSFKEGYKLVSFYIDANSLLRRSYVLRRDGWRNKDNIGLYQRMFIAKKIRSMRKYLHEEKRVFINNIIVTLPIEKIKLRDEKGTELKIDNQGNFKAGGKTNVMPATITIENKSNLIGIIDGQHRSYAYHEGDDVYEKTIAELRSIQNLLVTGILYPKEEIAEKRIKFEAQLFLEINANQSGASSQLKQEIEYMMDPFSTISISKHIINQLNQSGPLGTMFEEYWFEKSKLKTASVISFGLRPLVKFEGNDTLFKIWKGKGKKSLKDKKEDFAALKAYRDFCTEQVRNIFIGFKASIPKENWIIDRNEPKAVLTVTTINGIINCLRLLIENGKTGDASFYKTGFDKLKGFNFKKYKSSQYRKMGQEIYDKCFK